MKIRLRQSGGFAGLVRGCDVDTKELKAKEAQAIETAAARCQTSPGLSKAGADMMVYDFHLVDDSNERRLKCDDGTMTAELHQLIEQLTDYTKPLPKK